jgi:uncharacterized membrane protein YcjF (UPF0283 family)
MAGTEPAHGPYAPGRIAALRFSVLGPPVAAFTEQQAAYALVEPACAGHPVLLHLPALLCLAVVGLAGMICRKEWERGDPTSRFFSLVGVLMSGIAVAVILAQWLPTLFLDPCHL